VDKEEGDKGGGKERPKARRSVREKLQKRGNGGTRGEDDEKGYKEGWDNGE